jgi:uncharacterized membrane protein YcaP (DUF421 family)
MHSLFELCWGEGDELGPLAMALRALVMFWLLLALLRAGGRRSFGRKSSFDNVVVMMLGAVAARGVVGASPFGSTLGACAVVVLTHRLIGRLCVTQPWLGKLLEGEPVPLYVGGKLLPDNLKRATISEADLLESHRLERQSEGLSPSVDAMMERNGRISFVER